MPPLIYSSKKEVEYAKDDNAKQFFEEIQGIKGISH